MTALFTLILIVRNGAPTIQKALDSVRGQTLRNFEFIAMDGASTDGTVEILRANADIIDTLVSEPDKGPYDAMHKALKRAKGEFIGLLMADDWLSPDTFAQLTALHTANPQAKLLTFGQQVHVPAGEGTARERYYLDRDSLTFTLFDGLYCQGMNRFYHRSLNLMFDSARYNQMADRELYMRLGLAGTPVARLDAPLYHFLKHPASNSAGVSKPQKIRMFRETLQLARDYLAEKPLTPEQRGWVQDWYGFIFWRMLYFMSATGQPQAAWRDAVYGLGRFPLRFVGSLLQIKLPCAYQGTF